MRYNPTLLFLSSIAASSILLAPALQAAAITWDAGGADKNWSTVNNWSDNATATGDDVTFDATGALTAGNTNTVDTSISIASLTYGFESNTLQHTTSIAAGQTLTVTGNFTLAPSTTATLSTNVTLTGATGALTVNGTSFQVGQTASVTNSQLTQNLDMSGLGTLTANLGANGTFRMGSNPGSTTGPITTVVKLAANSTITANVIGVGDNTGKGATYTLKLGSTANTLNANTISIGQSAGGRSSGELSFETGTGTLKLRAADGTSAVTAMNLINSSLIGTASLIATANFAGHDVDAKITTLTMGRRSAGANATATATFTFDTGTLEVGTLNLGEASAAASSGTINAIMNIGGGNATFGSINMATNAGTTNIVNGTLNFTGGTTTVNGNITKGGGNGTTATLNLNGAAAILDMTSGNLTGLNTITYTAGLLKDLSVVNTGMTLAGTGSRVFDQATGVSGEIQGAITGSGLGLTKNGTGTLTLSGANTYSGATTVNAGILVFSNTAAKATGAVTAGASGSIGLGVGAASGDFSDGNVTTLFNTGNLLVNTSNMTLNAASSLALDTTAGNFTQSSALTAARALIKLGANTLTLSGNNTYTGATTISAGTLTVSGGSALADTGAVSVSSGAVFNLSASETIGSIAGAGNVTLGANTLTTGSDNSSTTLSGVLSGASGALTKSGTGTLTLSGANTYTGATTISAGTIQIGHANGLGSGGNITFSGGGLKYGTGITTDLSSRIKNSGSAILVDTNGESVTWGTALGSTNSGGLTKNGTGTLTLSGNNTYTGTTTISAGTLTVSGGSAIVDTGAVSVSSGAVFNLSASETIGSIAGAGNVTLGANTLTTGSDNSSTTLSGVLSGASGALTKSGTGTLTLSGANTYTGATTISAGTLQISSTGLLGGGNYSQTIANSGTFLFGSNSDQTLGGVISGAGVLMKDGTGTLTLTGANTYTGATTISAGTLTVSGGSAIVDTGAVSVSSGAVFNLSASETIGSIAGAGNVTLGANTLTTGSDNSSTTLSGVLSGASGALTKSGTGTLTLSGANTYTGATTISAGTLQISSTGLLGGGNYSQTIANSGTFLFGSNSNQTLGGVISGTGALTKDGSGTLTLTGANTYTGTTTISAGTLNVTGSLAATTNVVLADVAGATLDFSGATGSKNIFSLSGGGANGGNLVLNASTLYVGNATNTYGGSISGAGHIQFSAGTGTQTLTGNSSYTGKTGIGKGTLSVSSISSTGSGNSSVGSGSARFEIGNGADTGTLLYTGTGHSTDRSVNLAGTTGGGTLDASGSGALVFTSNFTAIGVGSKTLTLTGNNTADNRIGGAIVNSSNGSTSLTKSGEGKWILSGNNTYTGATTISAGTLQIGANGTSGTLSTSSAITNNGTLVFSRNNTITQGTDFASVIAGTGNVIKEGSGTLVLSGANTYAGATTISAGTLTVSGGSAIVDTGAVSVSSGAVFNLSASETIGSIAGAGNVTLGANTLTTGSDNSSTTLSGVLSGASGALTKSGTGTLTLSGANTYTGTTTISAGTLQISSTGLLGGGNYSAAIANSGTFLFGSNSNQTLGGVISGTGALTKNGTGTLTLSGANTYNGTTTISAGTLQIGSGGSTGTLSTSSAITNNGTLVFSRNNTITQGTDFASVIAGTGNVIKEGSGTLVLSGANTYAGATTISAGTLTVSGGSAIVDTGAVSVSSGAVFNLSASETIGSIAGAGNVTLGANTLTTGSDNSSTTLSGVLSGASGALTKSGTGTLALTGNNTYTGATTVNAGTLQAAATGALANTSQVVLNEGGSFLVTADNAVNDSAAINLNGGRMALSGNFNETVGLLTLSANSTLDFSGFAGTLRFGGIGSWATGANLAIWNWSGTTQYGTQVNNYANPSNLVFTNNSTLTSNLANISFYSDSGNSFVGNGFDRGFSPGGGTEIIAVPEPGSYATALMLLLACLAVQSIRRRAKQKLLEGSSSLMTQVSSPEGANHSQTLPRS